MGESHNEGDVAERELDGDGLHVRADLAGGP